MRLTEAERCAIKSAVAEYFGTDLPVRLFGSRVDDTKRGGDIDIAVDVPVGRATFNDEIGLIGALSRHMEDRKIDILLLEGGVPREPIEEIALRDGVLL